VRYGLDPEPLRRGAFVRGQLMLVAASFRKPPLDGDDRRDIPLDLLTVNIVTGTIWG